MKKRFLSFVAAVMIAALAFSFAACTTKTTDPSVAAEEKTELEAAQVLAENGVWFEASEETGEQLFGLIRETGELKSEALDVAISGSSTINTVYDYSFKLSVKAGNFFVRKKGEFVYKVGERFTRTYENGKVNTRYDENKLVVTRTFSKDVATLSEEQLELVRNIFESVNAEVMSKAFENVARQFAEEGYVVNAIAQENLADTLYNAVEGAPLNATEHMLKGYEIVTADGANYVYLTDSAEWAKKVDALNYCGAVGRVCYFANSSRGKIENILKS